MENMISVFERTAQALNLIPKSSFTTCFTGPRPNSLHGYDPAAYEDIKTALVQAVAGLNILGVRDFISGGAQGIDQLACRAVDQVKQTRPEIRNIIYIPFPAQPSRWRPTGLFSQAEYQECLGLADQAAVLAGDPDPADAYAAINLLHARNHAMVRDSDLIIAFLTGRSLNWQNAKGGTSECVRYAHGRRKPVLAIEYRPEDRLPDPFRINFIAP